MFIKFINHYNAKEFMMTTSTTQPVYSAVSATHSFSTGKPKVGEAKEWMKSGWTLYKKAPVKLTLITMLFVLVPAVFQALPAPFGVTFSKWLGPLLMALVWPIMHNIAKDNKFSFKHNATWAKWGRLALWSLSGIVFMALHFAFAGLLIEGEQLNSLLAGQAVDVAPWRVGSTFAFMTLVQMPFMFVGVQILIANKSIMRAVKDSVSSIVPAYKPMALLTLIAMLIAFLAPYTAVLSALLLGPILTCCLFSAYKQLIK